MKLSPLPYAFRETCRLVKRDIKNLFHGKTDPDCLRHRFHTIDASLLSSSPTCKDATTVIRKPHLDGLQSPIRTNPPIRPSVSTATTVFHDTSSSPTTPSTATEYSSEDPLWTPLPSVPISYKMANDALTTWYKEKHPARDVPVGERWLVRGVVIILTMAMQCCPDNPVLEACGFSYNHQPTCSLWTINDLVDALDDDRNNAIRTAQGLLTLACPEMNARSFMQRIGDPTKRITDEESVHIYDKLYEMLLPTGRTG